MKKMFKRTTALVCAVLMAFPFIHLVHAQDASAAVIESCTVYKDAKSNAYYFSISISPDWTAAETNISWCGKVQMRLYDSHGEPYYADDKSVFELYNKQDNMLYVEYCAPYGSELTLSDNCEFEFSQGYFSGPDIQPSDALTFAVNMETMNADRVCYCPYSIYTELSPDMVNMKIDCTHCIWAPVGSDPELRFEMKDAQAHTKDAKLNEETNELTILRRGVMIEIILYADGEPVGTRPYCIEKTYDGAASFVFGTLKAFGQGVANTFLGIGSSFYVMLMAFLFPFLIFFGAIGEMIGNLFQRALNP